MLSEEAKELRLSYVTGSDAAIICGISKYCTPYELWQYKTRRAVPEDISHKPAVKAGNMLEGAVRDWLAQESGKTIIPSEDFWINDAYSWMGGNIDGKVKGESAIVEIKTSSSDSGWGESGSNVIPRGYLLQIAHYLAVTGANRCYVGVLIRGVDFRHYLIERDLELEAFLIEKEQEFWNYVKTDTPPPPSGISDVVLMYDKVETKGSKSSIQEIDDAISKYHELKAAQTFLNDNLDFLKMEICSYMQDSSMLVNESGRIIATWNNVKGRTSVDTKLLKDKYPSIYNECLKIGNESRRFEVK